ncbi:FecCD family ABC transporter permease [Acidiluteibacter ferrifornacis]|uniref:Iron chelate uptake ABC transporter family permease subunit n=1 Tax=Acidiluteibacter ferrifornacis TaxID=2692424 RepID=A0A6N9NI91_9FLAO|nr:iron ABC transporter permease [Acidiluteibacter ferrifornacis]NBG65542.1 iron chelate uptake ABC transporter family permease subunit [Acidiluteibacter ferrifornacis]
MNSNALKWGLLIGTLPIFIALNVMFGSITIPFADILSILLGQDSTSLAFETIIWNSRIPRILTAILCGAAISISGLQMQVLFRNPLAGPYILGISSGASLGISLLIMGASFFSITSFVYTSWTLAIASTLGALLVLFIVFVISLKVKDIMTVLIVGIMLGSFTTALIGVMQYFSSADQLKTFIIWTMGSLDAVNYEEISVITLVVTIGILIGVFNIKALNLLLLGEGYAKSMGLNLSKSRLWIILSTGMLAGGITAFCGPIGFIGIVVPHLCRIWFKTANSKVLFPASILMGINFMLLSDFIAHVPNSDIVLPINSVTAILGVPIIFWMVLGQKKISNSI